MSNGILAHRFTEKVTVLSLLTLGTAGNLQAGKIAAV
jgi:hypothetical protein